MVQGYTISTCSKKLNFNVIHGFISKSYWASGIPKDTLHKAISNSLCFGIYDAYDKQVAFARIISDKATFAYLADVFVLDTHRGKGLSKWLIKTIISHPDLQGLRRTVLATKDAHGLYEKYGFTAIENPEIFMEIVRPNVYREDHSFN